MPIDTQPQSQPEAPAESIKLKTAEHGYSMKYIWDCLEAYVPKEQHGFIWKLALECERQDYTNRPWKDSFYDPEPITLLCNIFQLGPACEWQGTPFLNLELHPKTTAHHRQILQDLVRTDREGWMDLLNAVFQLGLHPKDLLPADSEFKEMLFDEEDTLTLDNKHLDDEHARINFGIRLAVQQEKILKPFEESYRIAGNIAKGSLDVLQSEVEEWLQCGQEQGTARLEKRLDDVRIAMRRSAISTDGYPAFTSFLQWLDGTDMNEPTEEMEHFVVLLKRLLLWRYPRSMEYGLTTDLITPLCEIDEDMD